MAPIVLIVALICLPVIIGACLATAGYKAYRVRHILEHDVERAQNANPMPPTSANSIEMRDLESTRNHRSWPLPRTMPDIVPTSIAPAVKPLPAPKAEIKGIGGGFVEHWGPSSSVTRMADSDERVRGYGKEKEKNDMFENADLYAGPGWNFHSDRGVSATSDIPAPQPMYTTALYGHYTSYAGPTTRIYGEDARAVDAWAKNERRESLVKNHVVAPIELPSEDDTFEDINLGGDSKEWREGKRPDTPVFVVGEKEQVENNEDEHTGYTPVHTPTPRDSFGSGRSLTHRTSFPAAKQVAQKSSWSTTSTQPSRRSTESTRQDTHETPSRTPSTRRSSSNASRKGSVVSRFAGRPYGEMSRKASVEKEKVVTVQELVGYVDSSDSDV
jgi:hypothetical protein